MECVVVVTTKREDQGCREWLGLSPDEIAFRVGARNGAEIQAYENDEDDFACIGAFELFKARRMLRGSNS